LDRLIGLFVSMPVAFVYVVTVWFDQSSL